METEIQRPKPPANPRFYRAAILWAVGCWVAAIVSGLQRDEGLSTAILGGILGPSIGLANWWIYHAISRRNDGLAAVLMGAVLFEMSSRDMPLPASVALTLAFTTPINVGLGLWFRDKGTKPAGPISADPLYDADTDRAANRESARVDSAGGSG